MTSSPNTDAVPKSPRRWVRILLVVSLSMNLMVLGVVAGLAHWHRPDSDRGRTPRVDQSGGPLTRALSREDRRTIGKKIWREYRSGRPSRDAIRAEYKAVVAALRADPFDAEVVSGSLDRQFEFASERQRLGQALLMERLHEMSAQERRAFADRLEDGLNRKRRDFDRDRDRERD